MAKTVDDGACRTSIPRLVLLVRQREPLPAMSIPRSYRPPQVCRWLLSRGADGLAATEEGNTVVMWAAWAGGLEVTRSERARSSGRMFGVGMHGTG